MTNKWIGIGRLIAKPELRYTGSNVAVSRFTLAVNRNFTNENGERQVDFINIIVWKKQAENVCNFLDKGSLVAVEGRIQTGSYEDRDGNKRYTTDIVADSVQFLESKKDGRPEPEDIEKSVTPEQASRGRNASPYDFQTNADVYSDFGDSVSIDDNFLD